MKTRQFVYININNEFGNILVTSIKNGLLITFKIGTSIFSSNVNINTSSQLNDFCTSIIKIFENENFLAFQKFEHINFIVNFFGGSLIEKEE